MKIVDPNNPIPKYLQISAWLRESILMGRYETGEKLPSEIELAQMCGVNRNTLQTGDRRVDRPGDAEKSQGAGNLRHRLRNRWP